MNEKNKPFELVAEEQNRASVPIKESTSKDLKKEKRAKELAMKDFKGMVRYWEWLSKDEALKVRKKRIKEILRKD